jgi:hypothetical protein
LSLISSQINERNDTDFEALELELQITKDERDHYKKLLEGKSVVRESIPRPQPVRPSYIPIAVQMRSLEIKSRREKQRLLAEGVNEEA